MKKNLLLICIISMFSFAVQAQKIWQVGIVGSAQDSFNPEAKARAFALKQGAYLEKTCSEGNGSGSSWLGIPHCSGGGMWGRSCTVMGDTSCIQNSTKPANAVGMTSRIGTGCGRQTSVAYREAKFDAEFRVGDSIQTCESKGYKAEAKYNGYYCYNIGNLFCPWKCLVGAVVTCKDENGDDGDDEFQLEDIFSSSEI
jgi:hypothetical protein